MDRSFTEPHKSFSSGIRNDIILHTIVHFLSSFEIDLPLIEVQQTRSFREVPSINITFANGVKDSMVLERFYPTQESRMARTPSCNFIGHLENEKTACVSLTGCASSDDLHFTINSKNSGSSNMYILHKDGHLELVERAFKVCSFSLFSNKRFFRQYYGACQIVLC